MIEPMAFSTMFDSPPFLLRFRRKLEAVRAVAEDVAERGAVAQNRSEIEEVSPRGCRLAWDEPR
jgi:hypothetical protein